MGGILVIQSHERPRAELLNVSALEIPTLPTRGFPLQGCKRLLGGDASVHKRAAPLPSETWLDAVSSWWCVVECCGVTRIGGIGKYWTQYSFIPLDLFKLASGTEQQKLMHCDVVFGPVTCVLFLTFSFPLSSF